MGWAKPDRSLLRSTSAPEGPPLADDDLLTMRFGDHAVGCLVCPAGPRDACSAGWVKFTRRVHRARQEAADKNRAAARKAGL